METRIIIWVCLLISVLSSCSVGKKKKDFKPVGEYIYLDQYNCIHVDRKCFKLWSDGDENDKPNYMIKRIRSKELGYIPSTCSDCVTDEAYNILMKYIESNEEEIITDTIVPLIYTE